MGALLYIFTKKAALVTKSPLIKGIVDQGIDVIGMVKATKQSYWVVGQLVDLKKLYRLAQPVHPVQDKKGILRSIHCVMSKDTPVKNNFIQNRNKNSEWLAILCTD